MPRWHGSIAIPSRRCWMATSRLDVPTGRLVSAGGTPKEDATACTMEQVGVTTRQGARSLAQDLDETRGAQGRDVHLGRAERQLWERVGRHDGPPGSMPRSLTPCARSLGHGSGLNRQLQVPRQVWSNPCAGDEAAVGRPWEKTRACGSISSHRTPSRRTRPRPCVAPHGTNHPRDHTPLGTALAHDFMASSGACVRTQPA